MQTVTPVESLRSHPPARNGRLPFVRIGRPKSRASVCACPVTFTWIACTPGITSRRSRTSAWGENQWRRIRADATVAVDAVTKLGAPKMTAAGEGAGASGADSGATAGRTTEITGLKL